MLGNLINTPTISFENIDYQFNRIFLCFGKFRTTWFWITNFNSNISKIAKVEVDLYAELGRKNLHLKDVIECDIDSIIPLDKTTSDPVDVYVDDILIAKGQIVAIEDSYGIKIVEIIKNSDIETKKNNET